MASQEALLILYVLITPSALFAAHWSIFVPYLLPNDPVSQRHEESAQGRRIHVSGDRLNGFTLEIVRGYNVKDHRAVGSRRFPVGRLTRGVVGNLEVAEPPSLPVGAGYARKDEHEGGGFVDNEPRDEFEKVCIRVDAPGPSLNHVTTSGCDGVEHGQLARPVKTKAKDCQWWVQQVVEVLVDEAMLLPLPVKPDEVQVSPLDVIKALPKH